MQYDAIATRASSRRLQCAKMTTYLLHDTRLALREGDVSTRLVLDELDFDLPALAARLVVVVVVVVRSRARPLGAAVRVADIESAVAIVVDRWRRVLIVLGDL